MDRLSTSPTEAVVRMTALVPMLQTNDMIRTQNWYEEVLGFRCVSAQGDEWCRLERDDIAIMFMRNAHLGPPHATATQYLRHIETAYFPAAHKIASLSGVCGRKVGGTQICLLGVLSVMPGGHQPRNRACLRAGWRFP